MGIFSDPVALLSDPRVKSYFMSILDDVAISSEEKYGAIVDFLKTDAKIRAKMLERGCGFRDNEKHFDQALKEVGQELGMWVPDEVLSRTAESIQRAIYQLGVSWDHDRGGWGRDGQPTKFWETTFTVLCLNQALSLSDISFDTEVPLARMRDAGLRWLNANPEEWTLAHLKTRDDRDVSVYHIELMSRCYRGPGLERQSDLPPELLKSIERLIAEQNEDGGWGARIYGAGHPKRAKCSAAGGTSSALRALDAAALSASRQGAAAMRRGIQWLLKDQNAEGSWNKKSWLDDKPDYLVKSDPSIEKTNDAVCGLLVGWKLGIQADECNQAIKRAVTWLQQQEERLLPAGPDRPGWGWKDDMKTDQKEDQPADLGRIWLITCMTLETLLQLEDVSLPLLWSNAKLLIDNQCKERGDKRYGDWLPSGDLARITLSLMAYYKRLKASR